MNALEKAWYRKSSWSQVFLPLAWLFQTVTGLRKGILQRRYQGKAFRAPVVIIGNINIGGTGKTPLIIALARQLGAEGMKAGIVSRGYGGNAGPQPMSVLATSSVEQCGDEALLIARRTACPVVVCADRRAAVEYLLAENEVNVILSDDGLQHYRLHRDLEIVVIDGQRGLGNGRCMPAGPLRESPRRLHSVDGIVINGSVNGSANSEPAKFSMAHTEALQVQTYPMTLKPSQFINLVSRENVSAEQWCHGQSVHAVAGIGNPERFRDTLIMLGLNPLLHGFPDHHPFTAADINFDDDWPVVMTAKDAVKCESLNNRDSWFLEIDAMIPSELVQIISKKIH
jgi:tetraacyldisaccharide 4'-kinase